MGDGGGIDNQGIRISGNQEIRRWGDIRISGYGMRIAE
jgi:hypothetical protein